MFISTHFCVLLFLYSNCVLSSVDWNRKNRSRNGRSGTWNGGTSNGKTWNGEEVMNWKHGLQGTENKGTKNLNRQKVLKNRAHFTAMISIKVIRTGLQVWKKSVENSSWTNVRAQLAQKNCPFESIIHWRNPQRRISHFGQNYCHFFGAASSARSKSWKRRQMAQNRTTFTLSWAPHLQWYRWTYGDNLKGAKICFAFLKAKSNKSMVEGVTN